MSSSSSSSSSSSTAIEKDILYKMKTTANIFLNTLKQVKKLKAEIDKDVILEMDNNYFIEKEHLINNLMKYLTSRQLMM